MRRTFPVITVIISMVCAPNYTMYLFIFILHLYYLPYSTTLYCHTHTPKHTSGCRVSSLPDFANSAPSNMLVPGTLLLHIYFIRQIVKFVSHSLLQKIIAFCTWKVFVVVSGYVLYCSLCTSTSFLVKLKLFYFYRLTFFSLSEPRVLITMAFYYAI